MYKRQVLEDYAGAALEVVRRVHREAVDDGAILVFLTGRREIEAFCGELRSDRTLDVRPLYAQMALEAQREAFAPTRAGRARKVVVATDVAARGLDVRHVSAVINTSLGISLENYVHRGGRCGRTGLFEVVRSCW